MADETNPTPVPYRQIRAFYDNETITVYQAYSEAIASAAVKKQKLNASPDFNVGRMTWIKPSWCWMMYRSGYAAKDSRQTHILALKMKHANFRELLSHAVVTESTLTREERAKPVRVQWDPERNLKLGRLSCRSIQIGISGSLNKTWVEEWIVSIEDVTERALGLKIAVEKDKETSWEELEAKGLVPNERVYDVPEELRKLLRMD